MQGTTTTDKSDHAPADGAQWLDIDAAAGYLRASRRSVYNLCAKQHLAYYPTVGGRRFKKSDLDDYIASQRVELYGRRGGRRKAS